MSPKIVLITIGLIMVAHGVMPYLSAGSMTAIEYTNPTENMIEIETRLNETIGFLTLIPGIILLTCVNIKSGSAKKVVLGTGISLVLCCVFVTEKHAN